MSSTVIKVEGLGKEYVISGRERSNETFREMLTSSLSAPIRRLRKLRGEVAPEERYWALKDVSFEVKRGEVLGIIGRNGAGKSTLLKILSRITEPSEGRVSIKGRVASLLEVGTGFHPELTGRENIYLNGAILGMTQAEIGRKFDEIVDFSGVEKFIDTPVKHYSSGMHVRLAFAVAAQLDPEILLVDEVLAVGDAEFQKKCLGKMSEVATQGRTVLFVSHNMNAVERLCQRVLCLEGGGLSGIYPDVREGILTYLKGQSKDDQVAAVWQQTDGFAKNGYFIPHELRVFSGDPREPWRVPFSNRFEVIVDVIGQVLMPDRALNVGIDLYSGEGSLLFCSFKNDSAEDAWIELEPGPIHLQVIIPRRLLNEGTYRIELLARLRHRWLLEPGRSAPMVTFSIQGGLSDSPYWHHKRPGFFAPTLRWKNLHDAVLFQ
jgi:homopolymeric O-antigen transport system ATP-binding protein